MLADKAWLTSITDIVSCIHFIQYRLYSLTLCFITVFVASKTANFFGKKHSGWDRNQSA